MHFRRLRNARGMMMLKEEFFSIVEKYYDDIYAFCGYLTGNVHDRDDLFQDTFVLALAKRGQIKEDGNVKSYLLSLSMGIWRNQVRKRKLRLLLHGEKPLEEEDEAELRDERKETEELVMQEEEHSFLRRQVALLPEKQRIPLVLFYMEGLSQEEISKCMKLPLGTVKSRLRAGKKILKERMEAAGYDR